MTAPALIAGGLCCVGAVLLVIVAAIVLWSNRSKAGSSPPAVEQAPAEPAAPEPTRPAFSASADLSAPADDAEAPTTVMPPADDPYAADDFDEESPTTLIAPNDPMSSRLRRPPGRPAPALSPPAGTVPDPSASGAWHRPAAPPPSSKRAPLDPSQMPDIPAFTLKPGATIIPPDDWNEDEIYDDDADDADDADATMIATRPPLPPAKKK